MNCRQVQSSLTEDLRRRADERIAAHLKECRVCRAVCRDLLEIEDLSRTLAGRCGVPEGFAGQVVAKLARERASRVFRIGPALAAMVLLGISIGLFLGPGGLGPARSEANPAGAGASPDWGRVGEPDYVDIVVTVDGNEDYILRLPSVIEVRRTELQEDFHISHVSH